MTAREPQRPRQKRAMTAEEIAAYLDARREWAVLTTLGGNGLPHSVTLGYFRINDDLYLGMKDRTQKVRNAERDPRAAVLVSSARATGAIDGVLLQGAASIVRDPEQRLALARQAAEQRHESPPDTISPDGVYLKLSPARTISWRYD